MKRRLKRNPRKRKRGTSPTDSHESSTTGRVAELFLGSLLLSNGFELYQPLVDVAIDYLAFSPKGELLRIQCKRRSSESGSVFDLSLPKASKVRTPTHVFYMRGPAHNPEYWLVPYEKVRKVCKKMSGPRERKVLRLYVTEATTKALRDYYLKDGVKEAVKWKAR